MLREVAAVREEQGFCGPDLSVCDGSVSAHGSQEQEEAVTEPSGFDAEKHAFLVERMHEAVSMFDPREPHSWESWLSMCRKHAEMDWERNRRVEASRQRRQEPIDDDNAVSKADHVRDLELSDLTEHILSHASEMQQAALRIRYLLGGSHKDVAEALQVSHRAARRTLDSALQKLRELAKEVDK